MPDNTQDRTEAPTPRRREEARKRGQIGRSPDLTAAVSLLGGLVLLHVTGERILGRLIEVTRGCLSQEGGAADSLAHLAGNTFQATAAMVLPLMLVVLVLGLVTALGQVGLLFTVEPLKPSLDKLNPLAGLRRMFSGRSTVQLVMGLAKTLVVTAVAWWTLSRRLEVLAGLPALDHLAATAVAAELVYTLGLRMAIALLLLAIIDLIYQKAKTERDLRMTREEIKEELRRMEGDPKIRARRREVQFQLSLQRIRAAVPKADVVITNPSELAVAIQYDGRTMNAPRVVAKGADHLARRIRELAIEYGVPIVERWPLAQALYKAVEVGREIPAQFYKAVAEILAYVYELKGRGYRGAAGPAMN